jgi:hypothetical protein
MVYFIKHESFHRSQALEVKLKNHEDVSEEREMISSISLDRQSANSAEALSNQIRYFYGGKK